MPIKITLEQVLKNLKEKKFELLNKEEFKNTNTKGNFKCLTHNIEWKCDIRYVLYNKQYCKECKNNNINKLDYTKHIRPKITLDMIKNKIAERNYILLEEEKFKNTRKIGKFKCNKDHIWETYIHNVYSEKSGCTKCSQLSSEAITIYIFEKLFNKEFNKTRSILPSKLELDGYNKELRLAIEYNGIQHYQEFKNYFHKEGSLENQINRDQQKIKECNYLGIELIIIPYNYNTFDTIKNYIIEILTKNIKYNNMINNNLDWNKLKKEFYDKYNMEKDNTEELKLLKQIIEKKGGKCISEKYINTKNKLKIKCKIEDHNIFEMNSTDLKRGRWCPECGHNIKITNEYINNQLKEYNLKIIDEYKDSSSTYTFECLSIFKHTYKSTWDNMKQRCKKGCRLCQPKYLIDNIKIYQYDYKTKKFIKEFNNMDDIKNNTLYNTPDKILAIRKNIKCKSNHSFNYIWSCLSPNNNTYNSNKELNEIEKEIIKQLNITLKYNIKIKK